MTGGGGGGRTRPLDDGWAGALLDQRARFSLALRITARLDRWLRVFVGPQPKRNLGRLSAATAVSVATDLAVGRWLRGTDRFGFAARLAADAADTAAWAAVEGSTYDRAVLTGIPLAVEAGARLDAAGLVVPAAGAALTAPVRRLRGWPARPQTFLWQVAGVGLGAALARQEEQHRRSVRARASEVAEARRAQARLDGQASVAMAADSVVDLLANAGWRLAAGAGEEGEAAAGVTLRAWKAELAERTRAGHGASYLSTALDRWEQAHNRHPDLRSDVELTYTELAPPVVLTARQVDDLHAALDRAGLQGSVPVSVVDTAEVHRPGRRRRVVIGQTQIELAADRSVHVDPFDPSVAVGGLAAIWYSSTVAANLGGVPVAAVAPGVVGSLLTIPVLLRRRDAGEDPRLALGVHAAVGLVHAGVATWCMTQRVRGDGMQPHPWAPALGALSITSAMTWQDLSPTARAAAAVAAAAIVGVGLATSRSEIRWSQLPLALAGPGAAWWAARGLSERLAEDTHQLAAELEADTDEDVEEAFADGRSSILAVASTARFEMWRLVRDREDAMGPELTEVVRQDLRMADEILAGL